MQLFRYILLENRIAMFKSADVFSQHSILSTFASLILSLHASLIMLTKNAFLVPRTKERYVQQIRKQIQISPLLPFKTMGLTSKQRNAITELDSVLALILVNTSKLCGDRMSWQGILGVLTEQFSSLGLRSKI